jgi:hypothetical protein
MTVLLENFVGPGFFMQAQTAEANAKVGLGALEAGVAPESRQPSGTLFAVPPSVVPAKSDLIDKLGVVLFPSISPSGTYCPLF